MEKQLILEPQSLNINGFDRCLNDLNDHLKSIDEIIFLLSIYTKSTAKKTITELKQLSFNLKKKISTCYEKLTGEDIETIVINKCQK